jgi:dephospho-CoA kinase
MLKIGLTGGIASGKSTVCQLFANKGISIIDADIIAKELVAPNLPCYNAIIEHFGSNILQTDGQLDRQKLRQKIFNSVNDKLSLERILHPEIRKQLILQSDQSSSNYCILAIPLLIESNMQHLVNRTLTIDVSPHVQLERLCQRDQLSITDAQKIISNQCDRSERLSKTDDIIHNNFFNEELEFQVNKLHQNYLDLAKLLSESCQHDDSHGQ